MIKPINRDIKFLSQKSQKATIKDQQVMIDLIDTLSFYEGKCVRMAANMIGVSKNIIAINIGFSIIVMNNPIITFKCDEYETREGCLSLSGERLTKRYQKIKVNYEDQNFKKQVGTFEGFIAQIIQHECDHLAGIII